jgi:hypothetical protein
MSDTHQVMQMIRSTTCISLSSPPNWRLRWRVAWTVSEISVSELQP